MPLKKLDRSRAQRKATYRRRQRGVTPLPIAQQAKAAGVSILHLVIATRPHLLLGIFSHLSSHDANSLALTNHAIRSTIAGIIETPDERLTVDSTQMDYNRRITKRLCRLAAGSCDETIRGGEYTSFGYRSGPCIEKPKALRFCNGLTSLPGALLRPLKPEDHVPGYICQSCYIHTLLAQEHKEQYLLSKSREGMCAACEREQLIQHPDGFVGCNCTLSFPLKPGRYHDEKICWSCRKSGFEQWRAMQCQNYNRLRRTYRGSQGIVEYDPDRQPEALPRCLCGRKHLNHGQRKVSHCVICLQVNVDSNGFTPPATRSSMLLAGDTD